MNFINANLVFAMNGWLLGGLITLGVIVILFIVLYFVGRKMQRKQDAAMSEMAANAQMYSALIIDKKRMKLKDAGFPQIVVDQTPKYARGTKVAVVKAKVGPQIMSLVCDEKIFESVPVKKEVKASVSGMYITEVKGLHGKPIVTEKKKKSRFKQLVEEAQEKAGAKPLK